MSGQACRLSSQLLDLYELGVSLNIFPFDSDLEENLFALYKNFDTLRNELEDSSASHTPM